MISSLHYALNDENPKLETIKKYVSPIYINSLNKQGISPLTIALYNKNIKINIIKYLLENGANVYASENKTSYILQAILNDKIDYVNLLIKYGSELTKKDIKFLCKRDYDVDEKVIKCVKDIMRNKYTLKEIKIVIKLSEINIKLVDQFIRKLK
jgi:ankyrin repeat protein